MVKEKVKEKCKAMSNESVLKFMRFAPTATALSVARLQWLRSMLKEPERHEQFFAAMFSPIKCEKAVDHPWLTQLKNDLMMLEKFDDLCWISECCACEPQCLLVNKELRKQFIDADF